MMLGDVHSDVCVSLQFLADVSHWNVTQELSGLPAGSTG